ncbi:hypothetical protein U4I41_06815, partial [Stenotrophomonas maltophilia]|nr:hypothetical protein [Stenotrophomonas maltophilia]
MTAHQTKATWFAKWLFSCLRAGLSARMSVRWLVWSPLESRGRGEAAGMWGLMKWGPRFAAQSVGLRRECAAASHLVRQVAFFLPARRVERADACALAG